MDAALQINQMRHSVALIVASHWYTHILIYCFHNRENLKIENVALPRIEKSLFF